MSIDQLNSAAWAAGFAMAPTEDDAVEAVTERLEVAEKPAKWSSASVPKAEAAAAAVSGVRQWIASWQRRATPA